MNVSKKETEDRQSQKFVTNSNNCGTKSIRAQARTVPEAKRPSQELPESMTACPYCRTLIDTQAERCPRCGHHRSLARAARAGAGSASAAMQLVPDSPPAEAETAPEPRRAVAQPSLFRDPTPPQKVVPIPTLTPLHLTEERPARRGGSRTNPPRSRRVSGAQQALDWGDQSQGQARPEEKISCSAPVAPPPLRLVSAAVDGLAVLMGTAVIAGIYVSQGGEIEFGSGAAMMLVALIGLVSVLYRALWCFANGDSPGMQFAGLRLIDFDGRRPDRRQRIVRQVAGALSLCAAGVGIAWALVDDESLTWHDHISKTFPTLL